MDGLWPTFQRRTQRPPDRAEAIAAVQSSHMGPPERVVLPLQDVPEDSFEVLVDTGEKVKAGQKIGLMGTAPDQVAVHASIAGEVTAVIGMPHPLVQQVHSVRILGDGTDARAAAVPFAASGYADEFEFFRQMGLPLDCTRLQQASTILINATEFEPCFNAKERILIEEQERFTRGLAILLQAAGSERAVILYERKQTALSIILQEMCAAVPQLSRQEIRRPCPDTLQELIRQKVLLEPDLHTGTARSERVAVIKPDVAVAVYDAHVRGLPYVEQFISVAGSGVKTPQNIWIKTGTPLADIIHHAGGKAAEAGRVTLGGPLMGRPQYALDAPLIKKAHGLFVAMALSFDIHRRSRFYKRSPCIRCGKCADVCPAELVPATLAGLVETKRIDEAVHMGLFSCLECGLCYYVCPSMIPLVELLKLGKLQNRGRDSLLIFNSYRTCCL